MNTRKEKVKFLNDLAMGSASIESLQPLKVRQWAASTTKPDWLTCKAENLHYPANQLPRGLNILNIVSISGGQPERNSEAAIRNTTGNKVNPIL